jgi:hypothetical protein
MASAPKVLINTWIVLSRNKEGGVQEIAQRKLLRYFGSVQALADYISENDLYGSRHER